jgi:hypothetical protein
MKIIEDEKEAELKKLKLQESLEVDQLTDKGQFTSFEINWVDWLESYGDAKGRAIDLFNQDYDDRLFFLASFRDKIKGKPQLIHENIQRIPVIRRTFRTIKDSKGKEDYEKRHFFFDDIFDKRYDGKVSGILSFDFYFYRIVDEEKEYYILSQTKLPNEYCEFTGMKIHMDDVSEISSNLKIKKISSVFICKEAQPYVKTISPEELIEFTKSNEWTEEVFHNILFCHPDGNIYDYTPDFNLLRKAQLLSSKYEGYPLHLLKMGPVGTGKTTEAEVLDFKFRDEQGILEAANSTLKVLVPSFKEKPANLGYIAKCNRIAIIDELMKMVEKDLVRAHDTSRISNYFGQINMLLEQKDRRVGSGNDNSTRIKATSKVCITSNNIDGKDKVSSHLNIIDPTTLSRMLLWVQDREEIEKIYNKEGIKKFRTHRAKPKTASAEAFFYEGFYPISYTSKDWDCVCGEIEISDFLTIYDSCQQFLVNFDMDRCKKLFDTTTRLAKEPMRQVWRARGLHHIILILDGIVKHRCLFIDYDKSYTPKDVDYEDLERIIIHMIKTWDTSFDMNSWRDIFS